MAATSSQFWIEKTTRKRKGEAAKRLGETYTFYRAWWIDQTGTARSKDGWKAKWRQGDALKYAADMAAMVRGGVYVADRDSATFSDAVKLKLHECEERLRPPRQKMTKGNLVAWQSAARKYLLPEFGKLRLSQITPKLVETWARRLVVDEVVSANTAHAFVNKIKLILDLAASEPQSWLPRNPLRQVKLRLPDMTHPEREVPQDKDVVTSLDAMTYRPFGQTEDLFNSLRMLVYLIAFAGLRPNEACALQWEDINWDTWEIYVCHGLTPEGLTDLPKTRAGKRTVDIMPILYAELEDHRDRTQAIQPKEGRLISACEALARARNLVGHVIRNRDGVCLQRTEASKHWLNIKSRAGLPGKGKFTLHTLRHYAGSIWIRDGISIDRVSRMLGHEDTKFTERRYVHEIRERDAARIHPMKLVSDRLVERYHHLGLTLKATPIPEFAEPPPQLLLTADGMSNGTVPSPAILPATPPLAPQPSPVPEITTVAELHAVQRARVLELWNSGMQVTDIVERLRLHHETVRRIIDQSNSPIQYAGRWSGDRETWAANRAKARELADQGVGSREIARQLGIRITTIQRWAREEGWRIQHRRSVYRSVRPRLEPGQISDKSS